MFALAHVSFDQLAPRGRSNCSETTVKSYRTDSIQIIMVESELQQGAWPVYMSKDSEEGVE